MSKKTESKCTKPIYLKKDQVSFTLERPDTYLGSIRLRETEEYVYDDSIQPRIVKKKLTSSPGFLRIFIELVSNITDNVARSKLTKNYVTEIRITVDQKTGLTTLFNDGDIIPIEIHPTEGIYNHSLLFGQLLTGSNYDDTEDREDISGRNGLGATVCNIMSSYFLVQGVDPSNKKSFSQTWRNNSRDEEKPIVTKSTEKRGWTKVSYIPDFVRFGLEGYSKDLIALYRKYVIDLAMLTKVKVYFNDELIPEMTLVDYAKLYNRVKEETIPIDDEPTLLTDEIDEDDADDVLYIKTPDCEVALAQSTEYQVISFANGIFTPNGGTHVDAWSEALFRPIVDKLNKPKKPGINIKDVKNCFRLFVVTTVKRCEFDAQTKTKLEYPPITASVKKTHLTKIFSWSAIDRLEMIIRSKEFSTLKKIERKKKGFVMIDSYDPANNSGTKFGKECTLILIEGLSAKTYAVQGIKEGAFGKAGRDWFGILPLRGKVLNCRNAPVENIAKNKVVQNIVKALGLCHGVDYTDDDNFNKLQYGRVMLITDADVDGAHISGLVQNLFHHVYPSLLERDEPFLTCMQTPIVKVYLGKGKDVLFYDEREYKKYVGKFNRDFPGKKITFKYFKGLASSNNDDVGENFGRKTVEFVSDEKLQSVMTKVFHNKYSDARKEWLIGFNPERSILKWNGDREEKIRIKMSEWVDTEMIKFSLDDCNRSIPNAIDGLKESHRKVLYTCFLRNLNYTKKSLKVAQLASSASELTHYHHGDINLHDTIAKMGQSFIGTNNIPLLYRDGQFGSRLSGGDDAGQSRYLHTKLDMMTRLLYPIEDDELLEYREDDGKKIEPKFYVPILPVILINGGEGIGTGWSCKIPCYNPLDICAAVRTWIENDGKILEKNIEDNTTISLLPQLTPWYRGYTGKIEKKSDSKYISWGTIEEEKKGKVVTELPVNYWTDKFTEYLGELQEAKQIKGIRNYCTPSKVNIQLIESPDGLICNEKSLKMFKYIHTSNMVLFTDKGVLRRFTTPDEIIDHHCTVRYEFYVKRKKRNLEKLEKAIKLLGNKKRFLTEVLNGDIELFIQSKTGRKAKSVDVLFTELEERGYDKIELKTGKKTWDEEEGDDDEDEEEKGSYKYLISLQIRSITAENMNKIIKDYDSAIEEKEALENTSEKDLWLKDLDKFEKEYPKFLTALEREDKEKTRAKKKKE